MEYISRDIRMNDKEAEQVKAMYEHYDYKCFVCGKPANQRAHILGNTKANRKYCGASYIDNLLNWLPACSLKCNALIDIGSLGNNIVATSIGLCIVSPHSLDDKREAIEGIVHLNIARKQGKVS